MRAAPDTESREWPRRSCVGKVTEAQDRRHNASVSLGVVYDFDGLEPPDAPQTGQQAQGDVNSQLIVTQNPTCRDLTTACQYVVTPDPDRNSSEFRCREGPMDMP